MFRLEVCLYHQVCSNGALAVVLGLATYGCFLRCILVSIRRIGEALFDLNVGQPFVCDFSPQRRCATSTSAPDKSHPC